VPGVALSSFGAVLSAALVTQDLRIGRLELNVGTLMMACMAVAVGVQLVSFAIFTKVFAITGGLLPEDPKLNRAFKIFTLEKGLVLGLLILLGGLLLAGHSLWLWKQAHFGAMPSTEDNLRRLIPAGTLIVLGIQAIFSSFFLSVLGLKTLRRKPPAS
jgi:hypothetical protein